MKNCICKSNECTGKVERFKIYSPKENTTYPNRFWGVSDYCNTHKNEDEKQGFVLVIANNEERTYIL
jgi:hypothetical protein